ncbi:hypothetical protein Tco_1050675, partial [Tanacetum coccineum]
SSQVGLAVKQFMTEFIWSSGRTYMMRLLIADLDRPLVTPFLDLDDDSDDGEVLNELEEYRNAGKLCHKKLFNSIDGDDLAFPCMIGFMNFVAYFDPFLPMNIITRKAFNTIMVEGFKSIGRYLVAIVRDVYVFVGSFT